ncbi:aldehyde dehydrogenase family protein [Escherichia coli]|uniref:aldehyde dehydrogenase family protein n=1 Tax=Escherichia coli TaxID=562 RepID=UPI0024DF23A4|nr:aldehyde dehydrogenase family protein [Escherichia coli]
MSKLHIGDGLDKGVTIGPLIDEKAVAKVEEHIADALEKGARVVCGGKAHERGGNFFSRPFWWTFRPTLKCRKKRRSAPRPAVPF